MTKSISTKLFNLSEKENIPLYVIFELTHRCNLRCLHCYIPQSRINTNLKNHELTRIEIESILDQLVEMGSLYLVFTGGEIFLRKDFFDIAFYARDKKFDLRLFTNGTLINEQIANRISRLGVSSVDVSIYGVKAETHDRITNKKGSFQKVINAIKLLKKKKIAVSLKCPLMKQNITEYENLWKLSKNLDVVIKFDPVLAPGNDGNKRPLAYRIGNKDLFKIFSDKRLFNSSLVPRPSSPVTSYQLPVTSNFICSAGKNLASISPYGDVYSCLQLLIKLGNLREKSFKEIWYPKKYGLPQTSLRGAKRRSNLIGIASLNARNDRKTSQIAADRQIGYTIHEIRKMRVEDIASCRKCSSAYICNRCPGLAYLEDGNLKGPSQIACQITKIINSATK